MQTGNRFFDDLAKVASGAASTVVGVKQELDAMVRQRIERLVADFDLVRRDEFEAVRRWPPTLGPSKSAWSAGSRTGGEDGGRRVYGRRAATGAPMIGVEASLGHPPRPNAG